VVGDGKNLSLQDIRFARTINRIQKSMLSELNKIAIVHLFLLGFEDELSNFVLTLNNPSTQADLLKVEVWKEKIALYKESTAMVDGIAPVSQSWAKKNILGFSDEEIKLDIQQQRIEKAVAKELENTPNVILKTGIFDSIDKLYGTITGTTGGGTAVEGGGGGGSSAPSLSEPSGPSEPAPPTGGPEGPPGGGLTPESKKDNLNILLENDDLLTEDLFIDLSKGKNSLGTIEKELDKLLNN